MFKKCLIKFLSVLIVLMSITSPLFSVNALSDPQDDPPGSTPPPEVEVVNPYYTLIHYTLEDGTKIDQQIINGPPEPPIENPDEITYTIEPLPVNGVIAGFPSYDWVFGCSAVSGAMIAGYYDRNGYPNMYAGPTNGGVMPLTDTSWPTWSDGYVTYVNNPLVASHLGVDGRTTKGSINDYWVKYFSTANDPYITGGWTQHTWGTAIGDYMKTSQSAWPKLNVDGSSSFWNYTGGSTKLTCSDMETMTAPGDTYKISRQDATYGRKEFYQARGYTVTECYNQNTYNIATGGFSLANLQAEIDAGNPVMLNLDGHTIVAYGYSGSTVYVRDTWDSDPTHTYSMVWDATPTYDKGSYHSTLQSVSIVKLQKPVVSVPKPISPSGYITDRTPTFKWTRIPKASRYMILLIKGTAKFYALNLAAADCNCAGNFCSYTPKTKLPLGSYGWQIKALVGKTWGDYSAIKKFTLVSTVGFDSNFNTNALGWKKVYGPWGIVAPGYYRSAGIKGHYSSVVHDNNYPIFIYSARMLRKGDQTGANRLYVRANTLPLSSNHSWDDGYIFQYSNTGRFSVLKVINGAQSVIKGWTANSAIKKFGWNTLKVVGVKNSFKFYINGTLVWKGTITGRATGRVGIGALRTTTTVSPLLVDWARLTVPATITSLSLDEPVAESGDTILDWDDMNVSP